MWPFDCFMDFGCHIQHGLNEKYSDSLRIHYFNENSQPKHWQKTIKAGREWFLKTILGPHYTTKKPPIFRSMAFGPSGESRTHGLLNPIQARYQTALHPDVFPVFHCRRCLLYTMFADLSTTFFRFFLFAENILYI